MRLTRLLQRESARLLGSALLVVAMCATPAGAGVISGRVVRVADGDTITVLDAAYTQHKIRLAGIDAPEKKQPFGEVSRRSLEELVAGRSVEVSSDKLDRYGRAVGVVRVGGKDVNRIQIERGMAWWYREYEREQPAGDAVQYAHAESAARSARKGIWRDESPVPPWEWRRLNRAVTRVSAGQDQPTSLEKKWD